MQRAAVNGSHKKELGSLKKVIRIRKGFSLIIAAFNNEAYRDELINEINRTFKQGVVLEVTKGRFSEFTGFENHIASLSKRFPVIHVVNQGGCSYKDTWPAFYEGLNLHREKIARENPVSIVLWMLPGDIKDFALKAPDMWAWRTGIFSFELPGQQFVSQAAHHENMQENDAEKKKRARIHDILHYLNKNPTLEEPLKALLYSELGELYYILEDYERAVEYVSKSLDFYRRSGDSQKISSLINLLESIEIAADESKRTPNRMEWRGDMPRKILVVNDEPDWETLIRHVFKKQIRNREWEFIFAANGREALEKLKEIPGIDVILIDIDFLEILNRKDNPPVAVIVITAYADMENIRKAMNRGAFDFLAMPVDFKELENTIKRALNQTDILKDGIWKQTALAEMQRELEIAGHIQRNMLPYQFPPFLDHTEFDIYARVIPAKKVGGDFYDFFLVDQDKLAFATGDVSGKGMSAALYMVKVLTLLRTLAAGLVHPGECLRTLNNAYIHSLGDEATSNFSLFYGLLDIRTGIVNCSWGGHPPPYILLGNGKVEQMAHAGGLPLGLIKDAEYEVERIQLGKDDIILTFTDGLIDVENEKGEAFGEQKKRLLRCLKGKNSLALKEIIAGLLAEADAFASGVPRSDDMTILALRYN